MAWQCEKCGKMNPNTSGSCIYCGAPDGGGIVTPKGKPLEPYKEPISQKLFPGCFITAIVIVVLLAMGLIIFM